VPMPKSPAYRVQHLLVILALLFSSFLDAGAESSLRELESRVKRWTLKNGVRVLFVKRSNAPVFAGQIWVGVGGVDEKPGISGIAHFLEHMAFKGSKKIGTKNYALEEPLLAELEHIVTSSPDQAEALKSPRAMEISAKLAELSVDNELGKLYSNSGAVGLNAMTSKDYTAYVVRLPSVSFEEWCWIESDRLLDPVFRQFYKEREVVQEERRSGYDDDPSGKLYELLLSTAFTSHPQRLPVIGYSEDLKKVTATQMRAFYEEHYTPENIVISIVGSLDEAKVRKLTERYFSRLPVRKGKPFDKNFPAEPPQTSERRVELKVDALPQVLMAYHKPTVPDASDGHFAVLHSLLADGNSSILPEHLVEDRKIALSISTGEAPGERYPNLFLVGGTPAPGISANRFVDEVQKEIDFFLTSLPTEEALTEAKKRSRLSFLKLLESDSGLASAIAKNEVLHGDWKELIRIYDLIESTTGEDIRSLVERFLRPTNRTVATIAMEKKK